MKETARQARWILMLAFSVVLVMAVFSPTSAPAAIIRSSPIRTMMHLMDGGLSPAELTALAGKYDVLTLSRFATWRPAVLRQANPDVKLYVYHMMPGIRPRPGDFLWEEINAHENWFVHDAQGKRITYVQEGWYLLDPAAAGYRTYVASFINSYASRYGYNGVWLDRAGFDVEGRDSEFSAPIPPSKVATWDADVEGFLSAVKSQIAPLEIIYNTLESTPFGYIKSPDDDKLALVDGGMMEGFAHRDWDDGATFPKREVWEYQVKRAAAIIGQRKIFWAQPGTDLYRTTESQMRSVTNFTLATFLMIADGTYATMTFVVDPHDAPDQTQYLEGYTAPLGAPLGPYVLKDNVYQRQFANGLVLANPDAAATYPVTLDGTYFRINALTGREKERQKVFLTPHRGIVLVKTP